MEPSVISKLRFGIHVVSLWHCVHIVVDLDAITSWWELALKKEIAPSPLLFGSRAQMRNAP
jgi:hypothetical protein